MNGHNNGYKTLLVEKRGPVVEVLLNRPEARNALSFELHHEFDAVLDAAEDDPEVRAVTLRGVGPIFSAGHDLKEVASGYATEGRPSGMPRHQVPALPRPWYFRKALIAGVHGYVGPAANHLLGSFDFIIAAEGTRFSFEQTRMGGGGAGGTIIAMQLPMRVMKKLYMMGGWFDAEAARQMQYVQRVVAADEVEAETRRWAEEVSRVPEAQIRSAKEGIHRIYEIMGLVGIVGIGNKVSGHGSERDMSFFRMVQEQGLREALRFRDAQFDQSVAQI
jgi:enoyl-CoA hydratase